MFHNKINTNYLYSLISLSLFCERRGPWLLGVAVRWGRGLFTCAGPHTYLLLRWILRSSTRSQPSLCPCKVLVPSYHCVVCTRGTQFYAQHCTSLFESWILFTYLSLSSFIFSLLSSVFSLYSFRSAWVVTSRRVLIIRCCNERIALAFLFWIFFQALFILKGFTSNIDIYNAKFYALLIRVTIYWFGFCRFWTNAADHLQDYSAWKFRIKTFSSWQLKSERTVCCLYKIYRANVWLLVLPRIGNNMSYSLVWFVGYFETIYQIRVLVEIWGVVRLLWSTFQERRNFFLVCERHHSMAYRKSVLLL